MGIAHKMGMKKFFLVFQAKICSPFFVMIIIGYFTQSDWESRAFFVLNLRIFMKKRSSLCLCFGFGNKM